MAVIVQFGTRIVLCDFILLGFMHKILYNLVRHFVPDIVRFPVLVFPIFRTAAYSYARAVSLASYSPAEYLLVGSSSVQMLFARVLSSLLLFRVFPLCSQHSFSPRLLR